MARVITEGFKVPTQTTLRVEFQPAAGKTELKILSIRIPEQSGPLAVECFCTSDNQTLLYCGEGYMSALGLAGKVALLDAPWCKGAHLDLYAADNKDVRGKVLLEVEER